MANRIFYNEILTEHNMRPDFKHDLPDANIVLEGVNPNCGDKKKYDDDKADFINIRKVRIVLKVRA